MVQRRVKIEPGRDLVIAHNDLREAGIAHTLRLVIQKGEIRIIAEQEPDEEGLLEELAGCLGRESASEYDFGLKIGGGYETR